MSKNELTFFEKQRDALISEISISMDSVLNNINALNRSIEGAIQVGKEFDSVASLWSNFYDGLGQVEQLREQSKPEDKEENETEDENVADDDQESNVEGEQTEQEPAKLIKDST